MKKLFRTIVLVTTILLAACSDSTLEENDVTNEKTTEEQNVENKDKVILWPTEEWPESSPEEQGMNSENLVEMLEYIQKNNPNDLHGLIIVRNGHIIAEKYGWPYNKTYPHDTYSVTKSLTGAIAGVAIEEGIINLDDRVLEFFPDMTIENMSEAKENMTIEQLLTMTNGIEWPEWEQGPQLFYAWENSENQLQYYLDQPIIEEQVGTFNYDTGAAVVLAAILETATGKSLAEYGQEKIFGKIGVDSLEFKTTNDGTTNGGTNAHMLPRDMARFGYLYLNNGQWDGEQIVPEEWVKTSTTRHTGDDSQGYGYLFWTATEKDYGGIDTYTAMGARNQYIYVVPEEDLIIVQTSEYYSLGALLEYIIPAIESDEPLPENEEAYNRLKELMTTD